MNPSDRLLPDNLALMNASMDYRPLDRLPIAFLPDMLTIDLRIRSSRPDLNHRSTGQASFSSARQ
jgi:hypothetical protein